MKTTLISLLTLFTTTISFAAAPTVDSFTITPTTINNGGTVTYTVKAISDSPVSFVSTDLNGPNGNIFGGGSGVTFTSLGNNEWEYTGQYVVSPYAPSGTYTFSNISVANDEQLISSIFPSQSFTVNNSLVATQPVVTSFTISPKIVNNGGTVTYTIKATSNAPINFFNRDLNGPNGNIFGGGNGVTFTSLGNNEWEYTDQYVVSPYAPNGTYTFANISVVNEGQLTSSIFVGNPTGSANQLSFKVNNTVELSKKITITSFTISPTTINNSGVVTYTIIAKSLAPVNFINMTLTGPNGNIFGGGSGVTFTNIGNNAWKYVGQYNVSVSAPNGTYTFSGVSVKNEAQATSNTVGPQSFTKTSKSDIKKVLKTKKI